MDTKKLFSGGNILLVIISSESYNEKSVSLAAALSKGTVCYVTLNKTHDALRESFKKHRADLSNVVFIDAITKTLRKSPDQADGCYFASSPGALTEISILVSKCLNHQFGCIVFDSLSNLAIYQERAPVARFISNIANQAREHNAKAAFYAVESAQGEELVKQCGMIVDKVVKI